MSVPTSIKIPSDAVIPAEAGIQAVNLSQKNVENLDPRLRGDDDKYVDVALARSFFYRLLSFLLRHPSAPGTEAFYSEAIDVWETALSALPHPKKTGLRSLENLFKLIESTDEKEWAHAFEQTLGHTANSQTPSYELEYGEEHSHRQPQQLADIAAFYQAFGLVMDSHSGERVDHASTECEFMSFLCFKEGVAREKDGEEKAEICRAASLRFFQDHLAPWLPAFATRLLKNSQSQILKQIADFTFSFMALESDYLQIPLASDQMPIRAVEENIETGCMSCALNPMGAPAK